MADPTIVWFRLDLRLADHPAVTAAARRGGPIIPVFIWAPEEEAPWLPGGASRWWLHQSLARLDEQLHALGSRLILRRGPTLDALRELVRETRARCILWSRRYEPSVIARDVKVKSSLQEAGLEAESFNASLLHEPWTIKNNAGEGFRVFTAFWKRCLTQPEPSEPLPAPGHLPPPKTWPVSLPLPSLGLEPKIDWASGFRSLWLPGEDGAHGNLAHFLDQPFAEYATLRNIPGTDGTSRLSPHLHFGEIGPRQIWHGVKKHAEKLAARNGGWKSSQYVTEIGWREFAYHLLFHFPQTPTEPLRPEFARFPWRTDAGLLEAWQRGRTGFPIIDAGMRELWTTGWMHNRVRMIVASFLVKDLLVSWHEGARWFWDTLVDADLASNTLGWQWTAGCGADAAPYFRVFNPVLQGEKFDPHGAYVRRWCRELEPLPDRWVHQPWSAPEEVLRKARVELGESYPERIVSHATARNVALEAYERMRTTRS